MSRVPRRALASALIRSFAIQGSWNYRTLIGCGFAFALLPVLRSLYANRPEQYREAVQRHTAVFNSHPYLTPMALGAVSVLEAQEPDAVVDRFKSAIRGSLGSLGDRLVWAGFRPVCVLLALTAVLLGASWALAAGGFLILYNVGHVALRGWAMHFGLQHGLRMGEKLRAAPLERIHVIMQRLGAFLLGMSLMLLFAGRPLAFDLAPLWTVSAVLAALAGSLLGARIRGPVVLGLSAFALFTILAGALA